MSAIVLPRDTVTCSTGIETLAITVQRRCVEMPAIFTTQGNRASEKAKLEWVAA